ncbi:ABC transporter permease [Bradyrhizobium manausense]
MAGIIASGVTFVVIAGRLDLSVGSLLSLCAVTIVNLHDRCSPELAMAAGLAIAIIVGCVNGLLVAVLRLNSMIATLGMLSLLQGVSLLYSSGQNALIATPNQTWFALFGRGYFFGIPMPVIILIAFAAAMAAILERSNFGRRLMAVGGNETAAVFAAISASKIIFAAYVISGAATGLAAIVLGSRVMAAQNDSGSGYELAVLAGIILGGASLVGGSGSVLRSVFGVILLGVIQNALLLVGMPYYFQWLITWAIIIGAAWIDIASTRGKIFA